MDSICLSHPGLFLTKYQGASWFSPGFLSLCPHHGLSSVCACGEGEHSQTSSLSKTTNPTRWACPQDLINLNYAPKVPSLNTITLSNRTSTHNQGRHKYVVHNKSKNMNKFINDKRMEMQRGKMTKIWSCCALDQN